MIKTVNVHYIRFNYFHYIEMETTIFRYNNKYKGYSLIPKTRFLLNEPVNYENYIFSLFYIKFFYTLHFFVIFHYLKAIFIMLTRRNLAQPQFW